MKTKFIYSVCVALTIKGQNNFPTPLIFENEDKAKECFNTFKEKFKEKHEKEVKIIEDDDNFFIVTGNNNIIRMTIVLATHMFCDGETYFSNFSKDYSSAYESVIENEIQLSKSMTFYAINGKDYLTRTALHHANNSNERFGTSELFNELFDEDGNPKNDNSYNVDEMFYGYVPENIMRDLNNDDFEKYINEHFD